MPSLRALLFLAWRALVVQPLKRLAQRGTGLTRFLAAYGPDGLGPTRPEDREVALLAARCTGCGLCEAGCRLPDAAPELRALGLPAVFRLVGRQAADLPLGRDLVLACAGCGGCERLCPAGVPIARVLVHLGRRLDATPRPASLA
ncbi:MAG: (Fe-S)-binding protein [Anaeromyxobacter sp.]|nr:(Fe-S)-binding protein [Anaeromyxobacter sp.]MBL0276758.1 (Fe-S)-binding protein [Anaeromyxobacter sp.]